MEAWRHPTGPPLNQEQRHQDEDDHHAGDRPAEQVAEAAPAFDPAAQEFVVVVGHRHSIPFPVVS